jgi:cobalt-zinc-cadmium efflux system outer membrane protein
MASSGTATLRTDRSCTIEDCRGFARLVHQEVEVGLFFRWNHVFVLFGALATASGSLAADEPLDVNGYVLVVLRSHPSVRQTSGLQAAADAAHKTVRIFPDPVFEFSRGSGRSTDGTGVKETETGYALSQTIPWPGTFRAGIDAGERSAEVLRAEADLVRWELEVTARETFSRLEAARSLLDIVRMAEEDARSLRDLVARRAELGESRESDRIKASVEWLRERRNLAAAQREAESAEAIVRALAVEPLPRPLAISLTVHGPLPALDHDALVIRVLERNPRSRAARAEAERQKALLSVAKRGRVPDLALTAFQENELDREGKGLQVGIKVPLWNANRGEIARAGAATQVSGAEAESLRIALVAELEVRLKELQVAAEQTNLLDTDLLPSATRSVELARFSFQEGETSLLDLLDAQRTFRATQREVVEAHLGFSVALAEVRRLVGPDFDPWGGGK